MKLRALPLQSQVYTQIVYNSITASASPVLTLNGYTIYLTKARIPTILIIISMDEEHIPNNSTLLRYATGILDLLMAEDWDTDDIAWKIQFGNSFHPIPGDILTEDMEGTTIHEDPNQDNLVWIKFQLTDYAS